MVSTRNGALCWRRGSLKLVLALLTVSPVSASLLSIFGPHGRRQASLAVSTNGSCGGTTGLTCQSSTFGDCCSSKGFCGSDTTYCGAGCQPGFGTCPSSTTSSDGSCGGSAGTTCPGSGFGDCCSARGFCGNTTDFCGAGCQTQFGTCQDRSISSDGSCGGTGRVSCQGSQYGNCCSRLGYCGANSSYCGGGCQSDFGTCFSPDSATGLTISSDGTCGGESKYTCQGSDYGNCCSKNGFCGSDDGFCGADCQAGFGTCFQGSSSSSSSSGESSSKLSGGAIAGVTIGSIFGAALLGGLALFLLRRRRASKAEEARETQSGSSPVVDEKVQADPVYIPAHELPGDSVVQEIGPNDRIHEKDGSGRRS